jgi:hypothetical protein
MLVAAVLAFVATLIYQSVEHHEAQKTYDLAVQAGYGGDAHPPESLIDILGESMIASAGGCLAGLVLWAFYRVVLFAIRG